MSNKAITLYNKLKRKAESPRLNEHENSLNFEQLNRDAVKSLFVLPEVSKTDEGFEVR